MRSVNLSMTIFLMLLCMSVDSRGEDASGLPASCAPPVATRLNVGLRAQETEMWCWAASGQMVMEYFGQIVNQCTQANNRFHRADCCQSPTPLACVIGGWPEFDKYGFAFKKTSSAPLSWDQLRAQLAPRTAENGQCAAAPFAFSWRWTGGGGHMMVATGYYTDQTARRYVFVNDPYEPNVGSTKAILYDVYVELDGDHSHWDDYYDVKHH